MSTSGPSSSSTSSRVTTSLSSSSSQSTVLTTTSNGTLSPTATAPAINSSPPTNTASGQNPNNIATSASLYLYTFLATLVLLLSVSAAIVIRSFVLRRRHRLMVEEAIRNGTWVPPAPPTRPPKVDLSKKPILWEAYIDKKGDLVGYSNGHGSSHGKLINEGWRNEQAREWDTIKPFAAAYLAPVQGMTTTAATPGTVASPTVTTLPTTSAPSGLPTIPSIGNLRAASGAPVASTVGPDLEAGRNATNPPPATVIPIPAPVPSPGSATSRAPRHRSILSRVAHVLSPTPATTSPLPEPIGGNRSNASSNINLPGTNADNGNEMAEVNSKDPKVVRVAVLIAMPSLPSTSSSSSSSSHPSLSESLPHPLAPSNTANPVSQSQPHDDDDEPLPHIEVGVADVLVTSVSSSSPTPDLVYPAGNEKEKLLVPGQRGSVGSMGSEVSEEV